MRRSALLTLPIALGALVAGYLYGYGVGEREGQDSDPEGVGEGPVTHVQQADGHLVSLDSDLLGFVDVRGRQWEARSLPSVYSGTNGG